MTFPLISDRLALCALWKASEEGVCMCRMRVSLQGSFAHIKQHHRARDMIMARKVWGQRDTCYKIELGVWVWWQMPLILAKAGGFLRAGNQSGQHSDFQASQDCTVRPYLKQLR